MLSGPFTGDALKKYRKLARVSQSEVAAELDKVGASSVCRLEKSGPVDRVQYAEVVAAIERASAKRRLRKGEAA